LYVIDGIEINIAGNDGWHCHWFLISANHPLENDAEEKQNDKKNDNF
jgi:hypothetical protein